MENCIFCEFPKDRILSQTHNFIVGLGLGPIVPGHILLIPKIHISGLVKLPKVLLDEMMDLKHTLVSVIQPKLGGCLLFEHGNHGQTSNEAFHTHAHMQIIPAAVEIVSVLDDLGYPSILLQRGYSSASDLETEYLYYESINSPPRLYLINQSPPEKFIKIAMLKALGYSEEMSDWKKYPRWDITELTRKEFNLIWGA